MQSVERGFVHELACSYCVVTTQSKTSIKDHSVPGRRRRCRWTPSRSKVWNLARICLLQRVQPSTRWKGLSVLVSVYTFTHLACPPYFARLSSTHVQTGAAGQTHRPQWRVMGKHAATVSHQSSMLTSVTCGPSGLHDRIADKLANISFDAGCRTAAVLKRHKIPT